MFYHKYRECLNKGSFSYYTFENIFKPRMFDEIVYSASLHPYKLTEGDRTRTDGERYFITCHHPDPVLRKIGEMFSEVRSNFFFHTHEYSTRIEICNDEVGSWLRDHCDDPAKEFTMQIYLSDGTVSTNLGGYRDKPRFNCGWYFFNTGYEVHRLDELPHRRSSIIVNYVKKSMWRDRTVLFEDT